MLEKIEYKAQVQDGLTIRPAENNDRQAVIALVREVLAEFAIPFGVASATDLQLHELPESYTRLGGRFWVAFDGDRLIGTVGVFPVKDSTYELRKMYLSPAARGKRLGQKLLDCALAWVIAHGGKQVVLDTTEEMGAAISLYERNGFVRDDRYITASRCSRGYAKQL